MLFCCADLRQSAWHVGTYNGVYKRTTNGDGSLMYAGVRGPVPTLRMVNIRQGLQDASLLRLVKAEDTRRSFAQRLVQSATSRVENATLLEATRQQVAAHVGGLNDAH